jgi:tetratricopeptide (TPR) repeat protein
LRRLIELFPDDTSAESARSLLAAAHRELDETAEERAVLEELAHRSADATDVYLRLMELAANDQDWETAKLNAERMLAVNPLIRPPHRFLAQAAEELNDHASAVAGLKVLAQMDPHDPADVHFRLATHLQRLGRLEEAKRQILKSLEEAPRFRLAHRQLLEILDKIEQFEQSQHNAQESIEVSPPIAVQGGDS